MALSWDFETIWPLGWVNVQGTTTQELTRASRFDTTEASHSPLNTVLEIAERTEEERQRSKLVMKSMCKQTNNNDNDNNNHLPAISRHNIILFFCLSILLMCSKSNILCNVYIRLKDMKK